MGTDKKSGKTATKKVAVTARPKPSLDKKREQDIKRWRAFAREYVIDFNGTRAAIEVGYSRKTATAQASRLLTNVKVIEFVQKANARLVERAEASGEEVVRALVDVMRADPRELVEVRVSCCRYCYGVGHGYQYTMGEYNLKREAWLDQGRPIEKFDEKGGVGYNPRLPPAVDCPECFGDGLARQVVKDTARLSTRALALYAGAKMGRHGLEVMLLNRTDALEKLMRHYGQYKLDNKQLGGGGGGAGGVFEVHFVEPPKRENDPLVDPNAKGLR